MIPAEWISGLAGGLLIGCAAAMFLLVNGRIMGASGLLGSVVDGTARGRIAENGAFLAGLIGMPALLALIFGAPDTHLTDNWVVIALAGLAVGLGTRMANGCTSGHGVCGISRFSLRGVIATLAYLGAGVIAMIIARHVLGVI